MSKKTPPPDTTICRNRKAKHRFEILEKIECGVVLGGSEVKSLREGAASIEEAYARIESGELWLIGVHIGAYRYAHTQVHESLRRRKLLVHGRESRKGSSWAADAVSRPTSSEVASSVEAASSVVVAPAASLVVAPAVFPGVAPDSIR